MDSAILHDVVNRALKAGADAAEAVGAERQALSVTVRLGALEEVEREESSDLGLRVFVGRRAAVVSGSDLSPKALDRFVERAVAMARLAPEDPYAGLADAGQLAQRPLPDLDLYDPTEPSAAELEAQAGAAEDAARAVDGVSNSDGGSASWTSSRWRLVTSGGFEGAHQASGSSLSASAIAGEGSGMERGGEGRSVHHRADLPTPEAIGAEAGRRAVQRLGARKIDSTTAPVIFENRLSTSLFGPFIGAIAGPAVARGVSFLKDRLGKHVFSPAITIADEPLRPRGLGSQPFDDEGIATRTTTLVDKGVLTTWLLNTSAARQLGMKSTGHAARGLAGPPGVSTHNLTVQPGLRSLEDLMRDAGAGLLVTGMFGPALNSNTGDWSAGASGFWFENGEIAFPVNEITVAGNLLEISARLVPGSDLEFRGSSNAPSLLVDGVTIAGR